MTVQVYTPQIEVKLIKLVGRKDGMAARYAGSAHEIDLTPYLGTAGAVRTAKSLSEPAGGFSVSFADATDPTVQDSLYGLIEAMDAIEIRAARRPEMYAGQPLPLIMRGYVSDVRRIEGVDSEGNPQRVVLVQGQDAGKLWQINHLYFQVAYLLEVPYLDTFSMQSVLGMTPGLVPVKQFMTELVTKVVNPKVKQLAGVNPSPPTPGKPAAGPLPFLTDLSVEEGMVFPQQGASFDMQPIWRIAETFADRPWNELFIRDTESGPVLVHRPAPYKDLQGNFIGAGVDPGTVPIDISAVVSLDLMHSDRRTANFFWVPPGNSMLDTSHEVTVASILKGAPLDFQYANDNPALYGVRRMEAASQLYPSALSDVPRMRSPAERKAASGDVIQWFNARSILLRDMNRDNSVLTEGVATVQGSESLQAGKYLQLTRGSLVSQHYIERVSHTIAPLRSWTTNLVLIRGTDFYQRQRMATSPAWGEGRGGPYL